jgi:acyl carrier protein
VNIQEKVRRFLAEEFLYSAGGFSFGDDESLLELGVVDSTCLLELVLFLEETFRMYVAEDEITPANLDSINKIAAYVTRRSHAFRGQGSPC